MVSYFGILTDISRYRNSVNYDILWLGYFKQKVAIICFFHASGVLRVVSLGGGG